MSLPLEVNYAQQVSELASCTMNEVVLTPSTGSGQYQASGVVKFDFLTSGMIDPSSIMLRFQAFIPASGVAAPSAIRGTPASAFFSKLEVLLGSSVIESIQNYNVVANMWTNCNYDVAAKYGQAVGYGWKNSDADTSALMTSLDGRICANANAGTELISFAIPLVCLLSNSTKMIPAFCMNQISLQLTIESLANIFAPTSAVAPATTVLTTGVYLQNLELTYNKVEFDKSVERSILAMPKLVFKSWSFTNSAVSVAANTSGQISLVYNQKLASIKSAFIIASSPNANVNGQFDAIDPTVKNGDINVVINGTQYPSRSLSTKNSFSYVLQSLRKALGNLNDKANTLSINPVEFEATSATSTIQQPGKFYVGIGLEKLHIPDQNAILAGVSSNGSNITVNINTATATAVVYNINLILAYDALFEVDTVNRDARVRQ